MNKHDTIIIDDPIHEATLAGYEKLVESRLNTPERLAKSRPSNPTDLASIGVICGTRLITCTLPVPSARKVTPLRELPALSEDEFNEIQAQMNADQTREELQRLIEKNG